MDWFSQALADVGNALDDAADFVQDAAQDVAAAVEAVADKIEDVAVAAAERIEDAAVAVAERIEDVAVAVADKIEDAAVAVADKIEDAVAAAKGAVGNAGAAVANAFDDLGDDIHDAFAGFGQSAAPIADWNLNAFGQSVSVPVAYIAATGVSADHGSTQVPADFDIGVASTGISLGRHGFSADGGFDLGIATSELSFADSSGFVDSGAAGVSWGPLPFVENHVVVAAQANVSTDVVGNLTLSYAPVVATANAEPLSSSEPTLIDLDSALPALLEMPPGDPVQTIDAAQQIEAEAVVVDLNPSDDFSADVQGSDQVDAEADRLWDDITPASPTVHTFES